MDGLIPFTLFGSGIVFGLLMFLAFVLLIASDLNESKAGAFVVILGFLGLNYFWGTFPLFEYVTLTNVAIYLFLGFLFSLIRTYFKGRELKKLKRDKEYFDLQGSVFRWWFLFPISLITWVFGTLLKDAYNFLYTHIGKIYESIFNL